MFLHGCSCNVSCRMYEYRYYLATVGTCFAALYYVVNQPGPHEQASFYSSIFLLLYIHTYISLQFLVMLAFLPSFFSSCIAYGFW